MIVFSQIITTFKEVFLSLQAFTIQF